MLDESLEVWFAEVFSSCGQQFENKGGGGGGGPKQRTPCLTMAAAFLPFRLEVASLIVSVYDFF